MRGFFIEAKKMGKILDRTGQKYGLLTIVYRAARIRDRVVRWIAVCDCDPDVKISVESSKLTKFSHCGCLDLHAGTDLDHNHTRLSAGHVRVLWPVSNTVSNSAVNPEREVEEDVIRIPPITLANLSPSELPLAASDSLPRWACTTLPDFPAMEI